MNPIWIVVAVVGALLYVARDVLDPTTTAEDFVGPQLPADDPRRENTDVFMVNRANTAADVPPGVSDLADAIAHAEGFGIAGAIPTRANNPGDLVVRGWHGEKLGAEGISVFDTPEQGWSALYRQLQLIADGKSHVYDSSMTIGEMADHYTRTQKPDWARNVATWLREHGYPDVTVDTTLDEILYV